MIRGDAPPRRPATTLVEILVVVGILAVLAIPFVETMVSGKKKLSGLPRRITALYFAHDLMEERLDKRVYSSVRSISRRRLTDFFWISDNLRRTEASEAGERRERIAHAREFLRVLEAEVVVVEEVPGRRKRISVTIGWDEAGHREEMALASVLER